MRQPNRQLILSGVLVVGLIASCLAMQAAFHAGNRRLTRIFAECSAVLCVSSALSIFSGAAQYVERRKQGSARAHESDLNPHETYIAKYSLKDRIIFLVLTAGASALAGFAYAQPGYYGVKILSSAMFLFGVVTTYRNFFTSVSFTEQLIAVEIRFFGKYSESYSSVTALIVQRGNLQIQFEDGKKLNLPSGVGDSAKIASILETRVEIIPDVQS